MKIVRYIYPPDGRVRVEGKILPVSNPGIIRSAVTTNRIEIFNIQGDLLSVIRDREKINRLKLQKGFYLLREKDLTGRIISSRKLVL
jgi:hypothetical protein